MTRRILITRHDWMQESGVFLGGGFWQPTAPLSNLLDHRPQMVAEAVTNWDWASTTFAVDLGYQRTVGLFYFVNFRASRSAVISFAAGTDPTFVSNNYAVTTSVWPQDTDANASDAWGLYTPDGIIHADEFGALALPRLFIPSSPINCRYILMTVHDSSNPDPLQIGCFGACQTWEPPLNFTYGWTVTPIDESEVQSVPFGSTEITERGMRRRLSLGFPALPESEIWARAFGLALTAGKSKPLVVVPFSDSTQIQRFEKTAVYGLVSTDSQLSNPYFGRYALPMQVDQLR